MGDNSKNYRQDKEEQMKRDYSIASAKDKLIRCGMRFQGKQILGNQPGIGGWGAADFLKERGYGIAVDIPKKAKEGVSSSFNKRR